MLKTIQQIQEEMCIADAAQDLAQATQRARARIPAEIRKENDETMLAEIAAEVRAFH